MYSNMYAVMINEGNLKIFYGSGYASKITQLLLDQPVGKLMEVPCDHIQLNKASCWSNFVWNNAVKLHMMIN